MDDRERVLDIAAQVLPHFATREDHTGDQAVMISLTLAGLLVKKWKEWYPDGDQPVTPESA